MSNHICSPRLSSGRLIVIKLASSYLHRVKPVCSWRLLLYTQSVAILRLIKSTFLWIKYIFTSQFCVVHRLDSNSGLLNTVVPWQSDIRSLGLSNFVFLDNAIFVYNYIDYQSDWRKTRSTSIIPTNTRTTEPTIQSPPSPHQTYIWILPLWSPQFLQTRQPPSPIESPLWKNRRLKQPSCLENVHLLPFPLKKQIHPITSMKICFSVWKCHQSTLCTRRSRFRIQMEI